MPKVVTCLLEHDGKILILKRSDNVRTYRGLWGGVAGYIEKDETPYDTAIKEIREEVGIKKEDIRLIKKIEPQSFSDYYEGRKFQWTIYPFLFYVEQINKIRIDWEHTEFKWIFPSEITNFETVPHLTEVVKKLFN